MNSKLTMSIFLVLLTACKTNTVRQELHSKKSHEIGALSANYTMLSRVQGKGCLKKAFFTRFDEIEKETFFFGLPLNSREDKVKSLAMFNAAESAPTADIFIHTSTVFQETDDNLCAEVKAIAGKLNKIGDLKL